MSDEPSLTAVNSSRRDASSSEPDLELLTRLIGQDSVADRALALRTRRAVYNAAAEERAGEARGRHHLVVALVVAGALVLALAPALWDGLEDLVGGETLLDLPSMVVALGVTLFGAVAAVLFLLSNERRVPQSIRHSRR